MKIKTHLAGFAILGAFMSCGAQAAPILYTFTATDFTTFNNTSITQPTVAGSVTLDGTTVLGIDLTIGSHTYLISEVQFAHMDSSSGILGGVMSPYDAVNYMTWGTNDFHLWGNFNTLNTWWDFAYTLDGVDDYFDSTHVTVTSIPTPVPVPETYAMLLAGLGMVGAVARRRRLSDR
jgi:hypothetical protein